MWMEKCRTHQFVVQFPGNDTFPRMKSLLCWLGNDFLRQPGERYLYRSTIFKCPLCWNTTVVFRHGQPMLESHGGIPAHFHPMTEDHWCFHSVNICKIYSGLSTCGCHLWWKCELYISIVILTIVLIIVFNMIEWVFNDVHTNHHMHLNIMLFTWIITNTIILYCHIWDRYFLFVCVIYMNDRKYDNFTLSYLWSFFFLLCQKENKIVNTYTNMNNENGLLKV